MMVIMFNLHYIYTYIYDMNTIGFYVKVKPNEQRVV